MGLLAEIKSAFGYEEHYDIYQINAFEMLSDARRRVRGKYGDDNLDMVRPKEAETLKFYIRCMNEQGGLEVYKHAMARWQIYKALYPEYITDADKPEFVDPCWKDPPLP